MSVATASCFVNAPIHAMDILRSPSHISAVRFCQRQRFAIERSRRCLNVRSTLPFPEQKAKYHKELEAAVDAVERACRLCVDVKSSLFSSDGRVLEKNDQTPVTVADFGVQALISLELGKLFPSIPLVAEEDSAFLRSRNLAETVVNAVTAKASPTNKPCTQDDVLDAIDRGGKDAFVFGSNPATYWVLDPIDGTRGFLKASKALYVVGLALVVDGEIVVGVMGCPNWQTDLSKKSTADFEECNDILNGSGAIMIAHIGCGTWTKRFSLLQDRTTKFPGAWTRCFVDGFDVVHKAHFCIPDSQTWESLPLSSIFNATTEPDSVEDNQILLLPTCCGSLCKYLMVASGRASVFILRAKEKTIIKAWDHAVGMICVHEAGGKLCSEWFFYTIVISNSLMFSAEIVIQDYYSLLSMI
ncbi:putative PAP-specific phosphatase, mitochondrial isoform X1 [Senna tora]|uniref:Putative PAP-specific phosphatase, mitochondrial isoform X1 n=1 Tax=Senna tora TaxID=362788 RepID=A0A834XCR1_9FABA|nr:putative PAP-specific phosphatase, mitochondrial isoform X1 [Senna tora]